MKTNLNALNKFAALSIMLFALIFVRTSVKAQDYNDYNDPSNTDSNDQNQYYQSEDNPDGNMDYYDQQLSDDGQWVEVNREDIDPENSSVFTYVDNDVDTRYIWVPNVNNDPGWNPYHNGRWVWTYYGWQWVSNYSWGYAPYHYGRWWYSSNYGWVWSPGYRWAPAWVDWSRSNNYVGWYPVSPREHSNWEDWDGHYEHRRVEQYWTDWDHHVTPNWTFVNVKDFNKTITPSVTVTTNNFSNVINNTKQINGNTVIGKRIVNEGPDPKNFGINKTKPVTVNNPLKTDFTKKNVNIQKSNGFGDKVKNGNATITKTPVKVNNETINKTPERTKGVTVTKDKTQFNTKNTEKFSGSKQGNVINTKKNNDYNAKMNDVKKGNIQKSDNYGKQKLNGNVYTKKPVLKTNGNVKKTVTYNNTDTKKYKVNDNNVNTKKPVRNQTPKQDVYRKNIQPKTEYKQQKTVYKQPTTMYKQPVQKQQTYTPKQYMKGNTRNVEKTAPQVRQEKSNTNTRNNKSNFSKKNR